MKEIYVGATALDPRFKLKFLKSDYVRDTARSTVLNGALALSQQMSQPDATTQSTENLSSSSSVVNASDCGGDVWAALDRLVYETASHQGHNGSTVYVTAEVATYFSEPLLPVKQNPLALWKVNEYIFPRLAQLAQVYLCPSPSSVQSERIFSVACEISDDRRSRLLPQNAEKLVFLKFNLLPLNYKY